MADLAEASFASESLVPTQAFIDAISKLPLPKVDLHIDCLVPKQIGLRLEAQYVKKAKDLNFITTFLLSFHAGLFFGLAAAFYGVVMVGTTHYGLQKMAGGFAYATGLSMVALCGGELFTGNLMMLMAWMTKRITTFQMVKNWIIVLIGNLAGALTMGIIQTWGRTHENSAYGVGKAMLDIAQEKCDRSFGSCVAQAILSNILMCWAIWMIVAGINCTDKQLVLVLPVACMAALGWEHIVSNFYFIPVALMIETYGFPKMWASLASVPVASVTPLFIDQFQNLYWYSLNWRNMVVYNFIPTVIGNMIGAFAFIALVYWYLYLRDDSHVSRIEFFIGHEPFFASPPNGKKPKPKESGPKSPITAAAAAAAAREMAPVVAPAQPPQPPPMGTSVIMSQAPPPPIAYHPAITYEPYLPAGNTYAYPTPISTPMNYTGETFRG